MDEGIGKRVADSMPEGLRQMELAARVGMTPDALSRALSGGRAFSSIEIAQVAEVLSADLHWLITGEPDPHRLLVAARHTFDADSKTRSVPSWPRDSEVLEDIGMIYRQATAAMASSEGSTLPTSPDALRTALGEGFVRRFADLLEANLAVDVVRVAGLTTAYSFTVNHRMVIALPSTGNWFWENWSMAHEYCHLAKGHHEAGIADEAEANAFAAELLLPAAAMREMDWTEVQAPQLATRVWDWGISTDALAKRLQALNIPRSPLVDGLLGKKTQALLRHHWRQPETETGDAITLRMDAAAARRFPVTVQDAHLALIADGRTPKTGLAWMLGVPADDLDVEVPVPETVAVEDLLADLRTSPEGS
ncbi:hypothetical protein GCM10022415_15690 [Knoellia locipacati]|uniref:HTH cro/C1-type domain-containing protein n=1 Tax=Knoellia locipacati TaxID=882824 RepID=A0A512T005_9MICO|nr:helix-turn-helix transcriptional regulator [Knoellia locipacati]GEQ13519.1 hypothetical protein KLO01_15660 [Knoellia locipacati]